MKPGRCNLPASARETVGGRESMEMKGLFRRMLGVIIVLPTVVTVYALALFEGKKKAVTRCGPRLTAMAKWSLRFWVPKLNDASEFDFFAPRMRSRFWLWKPFYDITVVKEDANTFGLRVENCPFCEALNAFGLPALGPYVCQGDWEMAKEHADKWRFKREHQIGTGDDFCDHTYLRKK